MVYLLFEGFLEERAKDSGRPFLRLCEETLIRLVTLPQRKATYTGGRATRRLKQLQQCDPKPVTRSETETWNAEPPSPNSGNGPPIQCCREGQGLQGLLPTSPLGGFNYIIPRIGKPIFCYPNMEHERRPSSCRLCESSFRGGFVKKQ